MMQHDDITHSIAIEKGYNKGYEAGIAHANYKITQLIERYSQQIEHAEQSGNDSLARSIRDQKQTALQCQHTVNNHTQVHRITPKQHGIV